MSRTLKKSVSLLLSVIMVLSIFTVVPFTASAADGEGHNHDGINFVAWTSTNSMHTTAGNYFLTSDVTISSAWEAPSGTNLCLN